MPWPFGTIFSLLSHIDMKTKYPVELGPSVASRQDLAARTFFAALILVTAATSVVAGDGTSAARGGSACAVRPFQINIPEAIVAAHRQRLTGTRWPHHETVVGRFTGTPAAIPNDLSPELTSSTESPLIGPRKLRPQPRSVTCRTTPPPGGMVTTENQ
jgi:hypothetical protein